MTLSHDQLLDLAKDALNDVFADTSVSKETTRESLEELKDEIRTCLYTLDRNEESEDAE